jgi:hypothetical protein
MEDVIKKNDNGRPHLTKEYNEDHEKYGRQTQKWKTISFKNKKK